MLGRSAGWADVSGLPAKTVSAPGPCKPARVTGAVGRLANHYKSMTPIADSTIASSSSSVSMRPSVRR